MASGNSMSTPRMRFTVALPSSKEIVPGMVARTQRFPSSRAGRNSAPSDDSRKIAPANRAPAAIRQKARARMATAYKRR
jgi:hypothetical protein